VIDDKLKEYNEQGQETRSQGSGGLPVDFLDPATCDAVLDGLRDTEGRIPDFSVSPPAPLRQTYRSR